MAVDCNNNVINVGDWLKYNEDPSSPFFKSIVYKLRSIDSDSCINLEEYRKNISGRAGYVDHVEPNKFIKVDKPSWVIE